MGGSYEMGIGESGIAPITPGDVKAQVRQSRRSDPPVSLTERGVGYVRIAGRSALRLFDRQPRRRRISRTP
jgi:hypothetical protein